MEEKITLAGSFCIGKCYHIGVTVQDEVVVGVTRENFIVPSGGLSDAGSQALKEQGLS